MHAARRIKKRTESLNDFPILSVTSALNLAEAPRHCAKCHFPSLQAMKKPRLSVIQQILPQLVRQFGVSTYAPWKAVRWESIPWEPSPWKAAPWKPWKPPTGPTWELDFPSASLFAHRSWDVRPFELTCAARLSHPCVSSRARVEAGQRSDASDASLVGSLRYHGAETRLRRLIATNVTSFCISKAKMSRVMWRRWQNLIAMPNTCRSTACCRLPQRKVQNKAGSYTTN